MLVRRPVKTSHLVVELAGEGVSKLGLRARRNRLVEGDGRDLGVFVVGDGWR